jgi:tRNA (adenine58-N1)-methyltransferase non-catalytic subunit
LLPESVLATYSQGKKRNYIRKRRRWNRISDIVEETRAGGFDGLAVASSMKPGTILHHLVPLLRGAAPVVVYSPNIETLAELADYYSTARRAAWLSEAPERMTFPNDDFPLDPTLLLAATVQTVRARKWQVLPGRTHPLMTARGGAEGYLFTGIRVLNAEGKVEGRGNFTRRKAGKWK